jgi:hypothetical protein
MHWNLGIRLTKIIHTVIYITSMNKIVLALTLMNRRPSINIVIWICLMNIFIRTI